MSSLRPIGEVLDLLPDLWRVVLVESKRLFVAVSVADDFTFEPFLQIRYTVVRQKYTGELTQDAWLVEHLLAREQLGGIAFDVGHQIHLLAFVLQKQVKYNYIKSESFIKEFGLRLQEIKVIIRTNKDDYQF